MKLRTVGSSRTVLTPWPSGQTEEQIERGKGLYVRADCCGKKQSAPYYSRQPLGQIVWGNSVIVASQKEAMFTPNQLNLARI